MYLHFVHSLYYFAPIVDLLRVFYDFGFGGAALRHLIASNYLAPHSHKLFPGMPIWDNYHSHPSIHIGVELLQRMWLEVRIKYSQLPHSE